MLATRRLPAVAEFLGAFRLLLGLVPQETLHERKSNCRARTLEFIDTELVDGIEGRNCGLFVDLIDHKAIVWMGDRERFVVVPFFGRTCTEVSRLCRHSPCRCRASFRYPTSDRQISRREFYRLCKYRDHLESRQGRRWLASCDG